MRVGAMLPLFVDDPARVIGFARRAEALGFDGVFAFDHLLPLHQAPDRPSFEVFSSLAAVAAATDGLTVGTLVTRASLRPAGLLAKLAASLDDVAAGRVVLAVGTGDDLSRGEHEAFGIPTMDRATRRRHLEDTVSAVRSLLTGRTWPGSELVPPLSGPLLPRRPGGQGPPVWVGGLSEEVVRVAGRVADAWNGWGIDVDGFARRVAVLHEEAEAAGRTVPATWGGIALVGRDRAEADRLAERRGERPSGAWVGDPRGAADRLQRLAAAGATWAVMLLAGPADRLEVVGREVLPRLRDGS
jgi:alkanesulfonate monooxygenase SsuD/methylene tetrahydromethanopterin reductase-like flavin-dependent oxidoreductase (luciferase family)